jgi:hypothetical protein
MSVCGLAPLSSFWWFGRRWHIRSASYYAKQCVYNLIYFII